MPLFFQVAEPPPAAAAPLVTTPDWLRRPSAGDMERFYPAAARKERLSGVATLTCKVTARGDLAGCGVTDVSPAGRGFEETALRFAPIFLMRAQTRDGRPVDGGTVKIPIRFRLPTDMKAGPVRLTHPSVKGASVEMDCRYRSKLLDNCILISGPPEAGVLLAQDLDGKPAPTTQNGPGRITITFDFEL